MINTNWKSWGFDNKITPPYDIKLIFFIKNLERVRRFADSFYLISY